MRICYSAVIVTLFTSLAVAQLSPIPQADASSDVAQHHRHEDDEEALPASAAKLPPDSPVITIEGVCDHPPDAGKASNTGQAEGSSGAGLDKTKPSASAGSACRTIVTKEQFEKLVDALNPQMSGMVRRRLAVSFPRLLLFANEARNLGLDQDPRFAEMMRFASIQILAQSLSHHFEEEASHISDSEIENYYKDNAVKFERAELLRIFIPKQVREGPSAASAEQNNPGTQALAQKLQARAAAGDDFQQLQKEAFQAAGISSAAPNVSTGRIMLGRLPVNHQKVFEMEPGQVSAVIVDPSGWYIYKMVSRQMIPLSQADKEIRKSISSQRVADSIAALTKSLNSELNPLYFGKTNPSPPTSPQPAPKTPDDSLAN
ncbi:MAG TPA: peptidylprolyl isomerase [Terriglobales bacterium]|nr:peptidylprolyl isomerase [Terriglobales bacterium]